MRQNIVASFYTEVVHDNVISNDVTITSALRSAVIILVTDFPFS